MWKFILGFLFTFFNFFSQLSHCSVLTFNDKQFILDSHNWIRAYVTKGVHGLPPTSNMQAMDWSEELEQKSRSLNKCPDVAFNSYEIKFRANVPYLTIKYKTREFPSRIMITNLIESILQQLNSSFYIECMGNIICKLRNQILEPQLSDIGCSLTKCEPFTNILTCAYNTKAVLNSFLESTNIGFPCSNCSSQNMNCLNDVLCAKESHCYKTPTKHCRCMITKESCSNRGIFLADKCTCICKPGYKGVDCQDIVFKSVIGRSTLLINTENKPNSKMVTKIGCKDKLWECSNWAIMGLCSLKTVRNSCSKSCEKCESDEQLISHFKSILMLKDAGSECVDKRSECQMWADNNYCYIKAVQINCPRVCALCPDPPEPEKFECEENPPRAATCKQVIGNYLCYSPDMKEVCPVTCGNTKCGTPLPTTTLKDTCLEPESHTKPCSDFKKVGYCSIKEVIEYCPVTCEMDKCRTDPDLCKELKSLCSTEKIKEKCKQTCGTTVIPISTFKSTILSTTEETEPSMCPEVKDLCQNPSVKAICKKTCASSTSLKSTQTISSTSGVFRSTSVLSTEPTVCPDMKDLCTTPGVKALCKKTCASSTTPISTTSGSSKSSTSGTSGSTTPLSTEPSVCPDMKDLCTTPGVKALCKKTCASSTTPISTTSGSSKSSTSGTSGSTTPLSTEPSVCPDMKDLCTTPGVKALCKKTCASSTTLLSSTFGFSSFPTSLISTSPTTLSTEPSVCPDMKSLCASPGVKTLCKKTCATTTTPTSSTSGSSKSSTSGTSGSTTPLSTEPSVCPDMKSLCASPGVKTLCKKTCATTTTPISSTSGSSKSSTSGTSGSTTPLSTEPSVCPDMKSLCASPGVKTLCKKTCATTTTPISSTLGSSKSSTSGTSGSSTPLSTESILCGKLKHLCGSPDVAESCKQTCETSTIKSSTLTQLSTTMLSTESSLCSNLKNLCDDLNVKAMCKATCTTSTVPMSSSSTSSRVTPTISSVTCSPVTGMTENPECSKMAMHCNNIGVKDLCPITCGECASTVSQHTEASTQPGLSTEFSGCENLKNQCKNPGVAMLCPKACAG